MKVFVSSAALFTVAIAQGHASDTTTAPQEATVASSAADAHAEWVARGCGCWNINDPHHRHRGGSLDSPLFYHHPHHGGRWVAGGEGPLAGRWVAGGRDNRWAAGGSSPFLGRWAAAGRRGDSDDDDTGSDVPVAPRGGRAAAAHHLMRHRVDMVASATDVGTTAASPTAT
ncbi:Aste57867_2131 [Aphanomyces stellatus]|uniref:Aste57867_2131 protein n=1 Tax=Aphanomyces stellatus TaxID=120398 RepID=A0A485KAJ5_9STRA|nr:hypothetical protein As57867_002126 [Aphanomyces stellatus]VFT79334.1 Aste57867_2131 [Aphanomyces stellatus]